MGARLRPCAGVLGGGVALWYDFSKVAGANSSIISDAKNWPSEVAPMTGPRYQLFIFFMITDPKATVQTKWGQCAVAFLVVLVEMLLRLNESVYAPLSALFLVGPAAH